MVLFNKKLIIISILLLITLLLVLTAGETEETKPSGTKLVIIKAGVETAWDEYYEEAIARYIAANPNVEIEYSSVGWADANTKLNTMFAGGNAPDIIAAAVGYLAVRANQFIPLDDLFNSWEEKDQYQEEAYVKGLYKGQFYGLGYHWDPRIFVYRKDLFEAAGLDPESPPISWEELQEYAVKCVIKKDGIVTQTGFDLPASRTRVVAYIFLNQNGTILADEENEIPQFDDPKGIETIEFLTNLYNLDINATNAQSNPKEIPFVQGTSAMAYVTPSQLQLFEDRFPELVDQLGFTPNIKRQQEATFGEIYQYFISNQCKNVDAAWDFMKFMLSEEESIERMHATNSPPVRDDLIDDFIGLSRFNEAIIQAALISNPWPNVVWSAEYRNYLNKAFEEAFNGVLSPEDALITNGELLKDEIK